MKKKMICALIINVLLFTSVPIYSVCAKNNRLQLLSDFAVDTNSITPLFNGEEKLIGFYYQGVKNGYAILDIEGNIIEYCYDNEIEEFSDNSAGFYGGFGEYFVEAKESDKLINVNTGEVIDEDECDLFETKNCDKDELTKDDLIEEGEINDISVDSRKNSVKIKFPDSTKYENGSSTYTASAYQKLSLKERKNLSYDTRFFSYNTNNNCGSTASAIFTYYYYDYVSKSYINNKNYIGTKAKYQKALVNNFKKLLGDNGKGTTYSDLKLGMNKYLSSIGKGKNFDYVTKKNILTTPYAKIKSKINLGRPCIVGLSNDPIYGNHWGVGVGYLKYTGTKSYGRSNGDVDFIKINNGWYESKSSSIVYINYVYVDGVGYIK